jgi:16S rRNA (cytidine1402-2'-O)-methyltransferase
LSSLLLIPTPLDFGICAETPLDDLLPRRTVLAAAALGHWAVENAKSARAFLKRVHAIEPLLTPLQSLQIVELPRGPKGNQTPQDLQPLLMPLRHGHSLGLMSEAGLPAVADPGAALVALAHREGFTVQSLPGSSSLVQALAVSGLNGQSFSFQGYLPQDGAGRLLKIRELEAVSRKQQQTQMAIETPYRNAALLDALLQGLQPDTRLAVSVALTTDGEWTRSDSVSQWRIKSTALPKDQPAIFSWLAS